MPVAVGKRRIGGGNSRQRKCGRRTRVHFRGNKAACIHYPYLCSSACAFTFPDFQQRSSVHWKAFETSLCSLNIKFIQISDVTDYLPKIRKNLHHHQSSNSELSLCFLFGFFIYLFVCLFFFPLSPPKLLIIFWLFLRFWVQAGMACWNIPKKQTRKETNSKFGSRTRQAYENCK